MNITDGLRGILQNMPPSNKEKDQKMSTCDRLVLETLGSQPIFAQQCPGTLL
jgi:hypothetical protein